MTMSNNSNTTDTNIITSAKRPGYAAFAEALIGKFAAAGVPLVPVKDATEKDGLRGPADWVCFEVRDTGDKLYCNRIAGGNPTKVETTVPYDSIPAEIVTEDMRTRNGRIEARVTPDVELIAAHLIPVLAKRHADGETIRARRAPSSH